MTRLRWTACALGLIGTFAVTAPVEAQGLNDVLGRLLSDSCAGLDSGFRSLGSFGPELTPICEASPSGAASTSA